MAGRPRIYETADELEAAIASYFYPAKIYVGNPPKLVDNEIKQCIPKPTVTGLALSLGFASKQSLYDYLENPEFSYPIKRALTLIEQYHEERLSENNVTGAIFALKNMGWKDKQEVEQSGGLAITWNEQRTYETK